MFSFTVDVRYSDLDGVPTFLQTVTNTEVKQDETSNFGTCIDGVSIAIPGVLGGSQRPRTDSFGGFGCPIGANHSGPGIGQGGA